MIYSDEAVEAATNVILSRHDTEYHQLAARYEREIRRTGGISQ